MVHRPPARRAPAKPVDPAAQRARDSDARRILSELSSRAKKNAWPHCRRNTTTASPSAGRRAQLPEIPGPRGRDEGRHHPQGSDIAALKRELAKLPQ
jgi:hypothetical protein